MSVVKVTGLKFNYYDKELYDEVSFQLNREDHAVLVGQNGSGKTTLIDLLTKKLIPDKGKIEWTPHITYSYLDQHYKVYDNYTVNEFLHKIYQSLFDKEKEMIELYSKGSDFNDPNYNTYLLKAEKINQYLINENYYDIQTEINKIISGLGIQKEKLESKLTELSSGQREKVYLAKMLLEKNDVLLLDEPTNYLDVGQVEWLKEYLKAYHYAFLVVSHDEDFLKSIANVVFHLSNKKIERYKGDYDYFLTQSVIRKAQYEKDYAAQQKYIKKEEEFIAAHIVRATSAKAAKSRRTRLSHLQRLDAPTNDINKVSFNFPYAGDIGKDILEVDRLIIGYDKPLLNPISFSLKKGDRIAVIGKNGIGKSTLIKTLLGIIPSLGGSFEFNERRIFGYYSQTENPDLSVTPVQLIGREFPKLKEGEIRSMLARCGVKANLAIKPLKELSGGEEAKTRLCLLTLRKSNILVLDEPTNHLDVIAKESLKKAIDNYEGVVILVSHEKEFYEDLVDYCIKLDS
ncbi:MAG: ABC-F family ATP-binding cassette domain-containing protein [Bacilli bacterium]|nr:ABC-F family ATP-binding cassette domain-containing protein [Bacilli bacterium]